jgi:ABC-type phosphate/phosphonate transport system substrate-binding protein
MQKPYSKNIFLTVRKTDKKIISMQIPIKNILQTLLLILWFNIYLADENFGQSSFNSPQILHLGYSNMVFQDIDPRDGNAALLAYAQQVEKRFFQKRGTKINLQTKIYSSLSDIKQALKLNEIDLLSVTTDQYFELLDEFELEPCLATVSYNNKFSQYILITSSKNDINNISDLKKKRIVLPKSSKGWLVEKWLNVKLARYKQSFMENFFSSVNYLDKETNAIYDIYFEKAECAVVRKSVFNILCELNPQLNKSIKILETSEPVISHMLAYRKGSDQYLIKSVVQESNELHLSKEGKLILEIFKSTMIEKITDIDLHSAKLITEEYNALIKKRKNK